jgi:inosine/xanthosine triphosphate pyrophosphatase family protein
VPLGETRTAAEMSASEKHAQSHRGQAMRVFLDRLDARTRK